MNQRHRHTLTTDFRVVDCETSPSIKLERCLCSYTYDIIRVALLKLTKLPSRVYRCTSQS